MVGQKVSKKVAVPVSLVKRIIRYALVNDDREGVERCLYCSWRAAYFSSEEQTRLRQMPLAEHKEWWRQYEAAQQHDKRCEVVRLRMLLGLPHPRMVFSLMTDAAQEEAPDDGD